MSAGFSFILYSLVFLRLRGNIVVSGWYIAFRKANKSKNASWRGRDFADNQMMTIARQMMLWAFSHSIRGIQADVLSEGIPYEFVHILSIMYHFLTFIFRWRTQLLSSRLQRLVSASLETTMFHSRWRSSGKLLISQSHLFFLQKAVVTPSTSCPEWLTLRSFLPPVASSHPNPSCLDDSLFPNPNLSMTPSRKILRRTTEAPRRKRQRVPTLFPKALSPSRTGARIYRSTMGPFAKHKVVHSYCHSLTWLLVRVDGVPCKMGMSDLLVWFLLYDLRLCSCYTPWGDGTSNLLSVFDE